MRSRDRLIIDALLPLKAAAPRCDSQNVEGLLGNSQPETADSLLALAFGLDHPRSVGTIGDTWYVTIQSHVVVDSNDLA